MTALLASIPSPSTNTLEVGPLTIHFYGILIGIGVVVAAIISQRRYERFVGDAAIVEKVVVWAVAVGFLGARLAYVSTHLARFEGRWYAVLFIWEGGLALFGGLTAGAVAAFWALRRYRGDFPAFADAVAIGLPVAQAIGRWGNYFNQELFGTPTTLPWGLEIAPRFRPAEYVAFETFHPTFLYESMWNLLLVVPLLLWMERRFRVRRGNLILAYLVLYGAGRFWLELLRTDTTFRFLGISRNGWVSLAVVLGGAVWFTLRQRRMPEDAELAGAPAPVDGEPVAAAAPGDAEDDAAE
jgi:prolipoprotein diacylglyceryl transferase